MPAFASARALVSTTSGRRVLEMVAVAVAVFVLIDAAVVHPVIWENRPTLYYFLAKPLWVGVGMLAVTWWLVRRRGVGRNAALALGGLVGIVLLQLYYTVVPVPIAGGEPIQIGLFGNLTEGLIVHYGALAVAIAAVVAVYALTGGSD